jgi:class 3 adenylate cyclase
VRRTVAVAGAVDGSVAAAAGVRYIDMAHPEKFEFDRARGVVWVCDIAGSSSHLNNDDDVEAMEEFLPRLHWTAAIIVDASGGKFIKWTGDEFLAWFETPLYRDLSSRAAAVFEAAWHLAVLVNVTQLGLEPKRKFKVRHGVAYEQDALLTKITYPGGFETLDLTGRAVVLAFRLSGVMADFPCIATQREPIDSSGKFVSGLEFGRWQLRAEDRLRFFKGERWGTSALYRSTKRRPRERSLKAVVKLAKRAIKRADGEVPVDG